MRIEFDPTNPTEAAAVRAMLTAMAPTPDLTSLNEPIADYISHVGETTRGLIANSAKVSQAVVDTLRVAPAYQVTTVPLEHNEDPSSLVNCDSNGEPHDPRIHSTPPKLNADGTWRAKRGVTAQTVYAVRAEREAAPVALAEETVEEHIAEVASIAAAFEESVTIPVCDDPDLPEHLKADPIVTAPPAPPVTKADIVDESVPLVVKMPPAPPANAGTNAPNFLDVMKAITAAQKDGKIDTAKVKELCAAVGAGESTMGLNGPDNGDKRSVFLRVVSLDPEARDALIAAAKDAPGVDTFRALLGDA